MGGPCAAGWPFGRRTLLSICWPAAACVLLAVFTLPLLSMTIVRPGCHAGLMAVCSYARVPLAGVIGVFLGALVLRLYRAAVHRGFPGLCRCQSSTCTSASRAASGKPACALCLEQQAPPVPHALPWWHCSTCWAYLVPAAAVLNDSSEDLRLLAYGMLDALGRASTAPSTKELDTLRESRRKRGRPTGARALESGNRKTVGRCTAGAGVPEPGAGDMRNYAISSESLRYCERVLCAATQWATPPLILRRRFAAARWAAWTKPSRLRPPAGKRPRHGCCPTRPSCALSNATSPKRALMQQLGRWDALPRLRPVIDYWNRPMTPPKPPG